MFVVLFTSVLALLLTPRAHATCPPYSTNVSFASSGDPPDPFTFLSGEKVTTKAEWACRRAELAALLLDIEFGALPPKPAFLNATFDSKRITVNIVHEGKNISFSAAINLPSATGGPFPAIIAYGGASIPINGTGIATIIYGNDQIASQAGESSRGRGLFYDLYGRSHSAGAYIAHTWGLSRLIDALELLGPSVTGIDTKRLGLTGCSRNGRGVLVAGAFEERIALNIPQEGGVGGPGCWRLYDYLKCRQACIPEQTDPFADSNWYRKTFTQHARTGFRTLPFDNHELIGLHAPRGLLILENNIDWLQPVSSTACGKAGAAAYEALGVKGAYGFSLKGSHNHCQLPAIQKPLLDQFLGTYLLGKDPAVEGVYESDVLEWAKRYMNWQWKAPVLT